jgi:ATP-binding cassette ChvD family protein
LNCPWGVLPQVRGVAGHKKAAAFDVAAVAITAQAIPVVRFCVTLEGVVAQFIFTMRDLRRFYPPDREVLRGINLSFYPGAKIGVIGANGSGKSSLLRIMAGLDDGFTGEARLTPGFSVGYLSQEPQLDPTKDVVGNVADGVAEQRDLLLRFNEVCAAMADPEADFDALLSEQSDLQTKIDAANAWDLERKLDIAMDALRLPPSDADVTKLSGGERRRVALCRLLLSTPDLLLLDEPTNHLDAESVAWLERALQEYAGTVVAITHDRYFLDNAASWILELDRGHGIPWEGNYSSWLEQKQARLASEEKADKVRQASLERELEWIRMSPRARQSKGKARFNAFNELVAQSEAAERRGDKLEIAIPPGPRLGDVVVNANLLVKSFDERLLMENLTFLLPPGGIVGVIGANGAGKTTLFKMMVGQEQPDSGTIEIGSTVSFAYVDQSRDDLNADATVFDEISEGQERMMVGTREIHARAYVASFGFKGSDQQKKVGEISGGERNRVQLAKVLRSGGNVLLLDEPTNDLDVDTLRALEDGLLSFPGCVVVISHDRWFLDRISTHVLAFEGDAQVRWFEGNFSDYEAERHKRLGTGADQPHRMHYKPITRA